MGELLSFKRVVYSGKAAPKTKCDECYRMRVELERAASAYCTAIGTLIANAENTYAGEYGRIKAVADDALIDSKAARLEWAMHKRLHVKPVRY